MAAIVNKLQIFKLIVILTAGGALAGCARIDPFVQNQPGPALVQTPTQQLPKAATAAARRSTNIADFISAEALAKMSAKDKREATSAQFYALQFGRPGAPRRWSGDTGATGIITVGPFVRVNNLDCRQFVHKVTIEKTAYEKSGTSCREVNGGWNVAAT
ncbi:hypothetical protein MNBD_ALPHA12-415 [hydrothermal vent metagenome]|uniref:Surface antigen domain-containing protein n=1 Tax=hydrothermal vent metagenome TaxID=652676 RepID=A0A3B0TYU8_9ZZZZ